MIAADRRIRRLAALVPKPPVNLARFHGGRAPDSRHRTRVTPAGRGRHGEGRRADGQSQEPTEPERRTAIGCTRRA